MQRPIRVHPKKVVIVAPEETYVARLVRRDCAVYTWKRFKETGGAPLAEARVLIGLPAPVGTDEFLDPLLRPIRLFRLNGGWCVFLIPGEKYPMKFKGQLPSGWDPERAALDAWSRWISLVVGVSLRFLDPTFPGSPKDVRRGVRRWLMRHLPRYRVQEDVVVGATKGWGEFEGDPFIAGEAKGEVHEPRKEILRQPDPPEFLAAWPGGEPLAIRSRDRRLLLMPWGPKGSLQFTPEDLRNIQSLIVRVSSAQSVATASRRLVKRSNPPNINEVDIERLPGNSLGVVYDKASGHCFMRFENKRSPEWIPPILTNLILAASSLCRPGMVISYEDLAERALEIESQTFKANRAKYVERMRQSCRRLRDCFKQIRLHPWGLHGRLGIKIPENFPPIVVGEVAKDEKGHLYVRMVPSMET